jgi:hypothetical protein
MTVYMFGFFKKRFLYNNKRMRRYELAVHTSCGGIAYVFLKPRKSRAGWLLELLLGCFSKGRELPVPFGEEVGWAPESVWTF